MKSSIRLLATAGLVLVLALFVWVGLNLIPVLAPPETLLYVRCDLPEAEGALVVDPAAVALAVTWDGGRVSASLQSHCNGEPIRLGGYPTEAPVPATIEIRAGEERLRLELHPISDIQADGGGRAAMIRIRLGTELRLERDSL